VSRPESYDDDARLHRLHTESRAAYLNRTIGFVGFMGVGKSTVGQLVADRLGRAIIDTDLEIERRSGRTILDFFATGQEREFRELEARVIRDLSARPDLVLALGGGSLQNAATAGLLYERCLVVHLHVPWAEVRSALPKLLADRPLLQLRDEHEVHQLYLTRQANYRRAHIRITSPRSNPQDAADRVLRMLDAGDGLHHESLQQTFAPAEAGRLGD
jgi:shikimate kinase